MRNVDKDNAPMRGLTGDPGKGTLTIPPNNGDLADVSYNDGVVRGDSKGFGEAGEKTGMNPGAPVWTEGRSVDGDAVNSLGAIGGDTKSDSMFEKFAREDRPGADKNNQTGSEASESVPGSSLVEGGADSDPKWQELPNEQSLGAGALSSQADKD